VQKIKDEKRAELNGLLARLLPEQRKIIDEIFPNGIPDQNLHHMCQALASTVDSNERLETCLNNLKQQWKP
jgi:hypothetical protein